MFVSVASQPGLGTAVRVGCSETEVEALEKAASGLAEFAVSLEEATQNQFNDQGEISHLCDLALDAATASAAITVLTKKLRGGRQMRGSEQEIANGVTDVLHDSVDIQRPVDTSELLERFFGRR
jgi:hypothetical protein